MLPFFHVTLSSEISYTEHVTKLATEWFENNYMILTLLKS